MNWRTVLEVVRSNSVSKACAVLSGISVVLPWLVLREWSVHTPPGVIYSIIGPPEFCSIMMMAAAFFDFGFYSMPDLFSIAALLFIAGAIISWWSPVGGVLQVASVYTLATSLVKNDYLLFRGTVEAEYSLGIGFHIGFIAAIATVFSLCPSGRSAVIKAFRRALKRRRPQPA